jgi:HNH endonuclease
MSRYISKKLHKLIVTRANNRCEYCRYPFNDGWSVFHIEHIISLKHGGLTVENNLAFACLVCNMHKGSDIATILQPDTEVVRLFHPRKDNWTEHFEIAQTGEIVPKTNVGEATIKLLCMNSHDSIDERRILIQKKLW